MRLIGLKNNLVVAICNVYPEDYDTFIASNPDITFIANTFPDAKPQMELVSGALVEGVDYVDRVAKEKASKKAAEDKVTADAPLRPAKITQREWDEVAAFVAQAKG